MKPPVRLLDDPGAPAAVRSGLGRMKAAHPGFDVARGLRAFEAAAAATTVTAGAAAAATVPGVAGSILGAAVKGALVGALTVGAVTAASAYQDRQGPPAAVASAAAPLHTRPERAPAPAPDLARSAAPPPAPPRRASSSAPSADPPAERAEAESGLAGEIDNLARARDLLASRPAEALALAEEGHRRFARRAALSQEREVLAIRALVQLGRRDEARARTARFLAAYPESPFGEGLRRIDAAPQDR